MFVVSKTRIGKQAIMGNKYSLRCIARFGIAIFILVLEGHLSAQLRPPGRGAPLPTPRAAAPLDLTGYWVSVVTEDWRWRMVTPPKGDVTSVPLNAEGRKVTDSWDPAKDEASGNQCKAYGAPAIMRVPGRFHIIWDNDTTLKIETDSGMQTRFLRFGQVSSHPEEPDWQGSSIARWEYPAGRGASVASGSGLGYLLVRTTGLRPGYLRKNGIPHSADATVTEYFERISEDNGDQYLIITTIVEDPKYLARTFVTSTNLKRIPDASGWNPTPCVAR